MSKKRNKLYELYLKSDEWKRKSNDCKKLADFECNRCGSGENLHAHHKTYDRIGEELQEDLECLCLRCHEEEHNRTFKAKSVKGGFRMIYKSYTQAVEETITSSNELKILNIIVDEFTYMKIEVHLSKSYIAKKTESSESSAKRVLTKMANNKILNRVRRGVYRLNPFMYIPFRADGSVLQKEWNELTGDENE